MVLPNQLYLIVKHCLNHPDFLPDTHDGLGKNKNKEG